MRDSCPTSIRTLIIEFTRSRFISTRTRISTRSNKFAADYTTLPREQRVGREKKIIYMASVFQFYGM